MQLFITVHIILIWFTFEQIFENQQTIELNQSPLVNGGSSVLVGNTSTLNTSSLQYMCSSTPYWNLNLCEISCSTCQSGSTSCNACFSNFVLANGKCTISSQYGYYYSYCTTNIFDISSIQKFSLPQDYLSYNNVVNFCIPNTYQFQMLGLFSQRDFIYYSASFAQQITDVQLRFNFFSRFPNINVVINVNNELMYSYTFAELVTLSPIYELSTDSNSPNYIEVSALNSLSASNLIHVIDTGFYSLASSDIYNFEIEITYLNDQLSTQVFWAFSDFSVTAKRCQNCVTNYVKNLGRKIGIAVGITFGILVFLVFVLYMSILYQRYIRFSQMKSQNNSEVLRKQAKINFNRVTSFAIQESQQKIPINQSILKQIQQEQQNQNAQISLQKNNNNELKNIRSLKEL